MWACPAYAPHVAVTALGLVFDMQNFLISSDLYLISSDLAIDLAGGGEILGDYGR